MYVCFIYIVRTFVDIEIIICFNLFLFTLYIVITMHVLPPAEQIQYNTIIFIVPYKITFYIGFNTIKLDLYTCIILRNMK